MSCWGSPAGETMSLVIAFLTHVTTAATHVTTHVTTAAVVIHKLQNYSFESLAICFKTSNLQCPGVCRCSPMKKEVSNHWSEHWTACHKSLVFILKILIFCYSSLENHFTHQYFRFPVRKLEKLIFICKALQKAWMNYKKIKNTILYISTPF